MLCWFGICDGVVSSDFVWGVFLMKNLTSEQIIVKIISVSLLIFGSIIFLPALYDTIVYSFLGPGSLLPGGTLHFRFKANVLGEIIFELLSIFLIIFVSYALWKRKTWARKILILFSLLWLIIGFLVLGVSLAFGATIYSFEFFLTIILSIGLPLLIGPYFLFSKRMKEYFSTK